MSPLCSAESNTKRSVHIDLGFISGNPVVRVSRQHNTGLTAEGILRSSPAHPLLTFFMKTFVCFCQSASDGSG